MRSFKGNTSSKRSMDRKTADALRKEKAAQKKIDERSRRNSSNKAQKDK